MAAQKALRLEDPQEVVKGSSLEPTREGNHTLVQGGAFFLMCAREEEGKCMSVCSGGVASTQGGVSLGIHILSKVSMACCLPVLSFSIVSKPSIPPEPAQAHGCQSCGHIKAGCVGWACIFCLKMAGAGVLTLAYNIRDQS